MSIRVTELDEHTESAWESYVAAHPDGTFFHTLIWRDAVAETFHHASRYLIAWRGDRVAGVFPLTKVNSHLAGVILVSVPYAVYGGTLADDDEAHRAMLDRATRLAERMNAQWVDIRSITPQWPELPVVQRYVTFRKTLPDDPNRVLSELPRKARAAARQARDRFKLTACFDDHHLETVWSLYSQSMRRLASPNYPTRFFRSLVDRTRGESDDDRAPRHLIQLIEHENQPVAGLISFMYRGVMMPYFAGYDERYEKYHPNNFMYLSAMEKGVELGCRAFDFGRTRIDNKGACDFKRFQGFEPTPLNYQYYIPQGGRVPDLTPHHPRLQLARRVWPKLPLTVTRPLGAWLSKSIPG